MGNGVFNPEKTLPILTKGVTTINAKWNVHTGTFRVWRVPDYWVLPLIRRGSSWCFSFIIWELSCLPSFLCSLWFYQTKRIALKNWVAETTFMYSPQELLFETRKLWSESARCQNEFQVGIFYPYIKQFLAQRRHVSKEADLLGCSLLQLWMALFIES